MIGPGISSRSRILEPSSGSSTTEASAGKWAEPVRLMRLRLASALGFREAWAGAGGMIDGLMRLELFANRPVHAAFIRPQMRFAGGYGNDDRAQGCGGQLATWNDRALPPRSTKEKTASFFGVLPLRLRDLPPTCVS